MTHTTAEPLPTPNAHWKVTVEFTSDDGIGPPDTTTISQTGYWVDSLRPVNECVAITMSQVVQMLLGSGQLVRASEFRESAEAFADAVD